MSVALDDHGEMVPGRGATTWTMDVADGGVTRHVVFFSSTTVNDGVRLLNNPRYPGIVGDYEATFAKLRALRLGLICEHQE